MKAGKECRSLLRQQFSFSRARHGQISSIWLQRAHLVFALRTFALWALSPGCKCLSMLKCSIRATQFIALFQHSPFCVICTCTPVKGFSASVMDCLYKSGPATFLQQLGVGRLLSNARQQGHAVLMCELHWAG